MATKKKNIPTQADLKIHYAYLDDRFGVHEGRLIPIEIYRNGTIELVKLYMDQINPGIIRTDVNAKNPVRLFNMRGGQYQEPKLVWLYHTGKYPQNAVMHKDGNRLNCKIKNLELTNAAYITPSSSGVAGIHQLTTGTNAYMWTATYTKNQYEERAVDKDGHILHKDGWKTKGWHMRKTKIINKRSRILIGYYQTKERAIKALRLYTNEVEHAICRYRTDMKLKRLFLTLNGMFPNNPSSATWHYIQLLYNRGVITEAEALHYMDVLGHGNKILPLRDE